MRGCARRAVTCALVGLLAVACAGVPSGCRGCTGAPANTGPVAPGGDVGQTDVTGGLAPVLAVLPAGTGLTVPRLCGEEGVLLSYDSNGLGVRATWEFGADLTDVAAGIVEAYRDDGSFELAYSGYLDLLGGTWGCVVVGDAGWVELAVVRRQATDALPGDEKGGSACAVTVARLGQEEVGV